MFDFIPQIEEDEVHRSLNDFETQKHSLKIVINK